MSVDDLGIHRETYNAGLAVSFATVFSLEKLRSHASVTPHTARVSRFV